MAWVECFELLLELALVAGRQEVCGLWSVVCSLWSVVYSLKYSALIFFKIF